MLTGQGGVGERSLVRAIAISRDGVYVARGSQDSIGPYRLLNLIMTGQTSQVWEAMHDIKRERFAIKILLPECAKDSEHVAFMKNEFAVGSKLEHPRVIRLHELGTFQKAPYLAMEFFPFPNVKQFVRRGFDQVGFRVAQIIEQAAEGLAYFNEQGWIHRDVKPDNFLISPEGDVKLIDFALAMKVRTGLAKLFGGKVKKIQGTRSYMSPEQIRGLALDPRTDVYSFGCTAFEIVTGKPPYTGASSNDLLMKHLKSPPPPLEAVDRNVTSDFSELVKRAMAKLPEQRPKSVQAFLDEFRTLRVFKIPPKPPEADAKKRPVP